MKTIQQPNLAQYHTFAISQQARVLISLERADELADLWQCQAQEPLVIGEGANLLFVEPVERPLVKLDFKKVQIDEFDDHYQCRVEAGKDWHELVVELTELGIAGLENLALIPGSVGAAPIQNIGAYGVEFCQLCDSVDVFDWHKGYFRTLSAKQCKFGYRDSIFKSVEGSGLIVVAVTLRLTKKWQPQISYQGIQTQLDSETPSAVEVMQAVIAVRQQKLPDPKINGNAGSFFKNPTLPDELADSLAESYPDMPQFKQLSGVKVPAAWLIDQRGWKGKIQGGAQVHPQQALVLVNHQQAKAHDILRLAHDIKLDVSTHYGIELLPEVRFIGAHGEMTLEQAYASTCV